MTSFSLPLISIIIPCYNAEPWIGECLDSAIGQTYRPLEIIVIDDGSKDGSLAIIQRYTQQHPDLIQYETGTNRGACAARNRGFALSMGDYVMFLDADDCVRQDAVECLVSALASAYFEFACCPSSCLSRNESGEWVKREHNFVLERRKENDLLKVFLVSSSPPPCALLWRRELIQRISGWDETLSAYQDVDFLWRAILEGGGRLVETEEGEAYYRDTGASSISKQNTTEKIFSRLAVLNRIESMLAKNGLTEQYRIPLGQAYYGHAIRYGLSHAGVSRKFEISAFNVAGWKAITGTKFHNILSIMLGLRTKLWLSAILASMGVIRRTH